MGLHMFNKIAILRQKVSSHPFPSPSLYVLSLFLLVVTFWTNLGSSCRRWGGKLDFGVDSEIR
jgi:hypothetical protein